MGRQRRLKSARLVAIMFTDVLSRAYNSMYYYSSGDKQYYDKAFADAQSALTLDPNLPAAHIAQGLLLWTPNNGFDYEGAIKEYRLTLNNHQKNRESAQAHYQIGLVYLHIGLFDKARK